MVEGRRAETEPHLQRVLAAITAANADREAITVAGIARRAGVDRTFFYRHRHLLDHIHVLAAQPSNPDPGAVSRASLQADLHAAQARDPDPGAVSRASLQADLHAAQARCARYAARVLQVERRLSELMGAQTWQASGLGAPDDID